MLKRWTSYLYILFAIYLFIYLFVCLFIYYLRGVQRQFLNYVKSTNENCLCCVCKNTWGSYEVSLNYILIVTQQIHSWPQTSSVVLRPKYTVTIKTRTP